MQYVHSNTEYYTKALYFQKKSLNGKESTSSSHTTQGEIHSSSTYSSLPIQSYIGINSYVGPKSGKILIHTQVISHMVDHFSVFNKTYTFHTENHFSVSNKTCLFLQMTSYFFSTLNQKGCNMQRVLPLNPQSEFHLSFITTNSSVSII